ncbi:HNH endonuclease, partial [Vibrio anguillarum]|nr:HNH endonuclease [Vibrio anguillarum]
MGSVIAPHCRFLQLLVVLLFCDGLTAFRDGDG